MLRLIIVASILLSLSSGTYAASFNCSKASTAVEKAICLDSGLSNLDSIMAAEYKTVLRTAANRELVVANQRDWLRLVRGTCKTLECLNVAYQNRIAALQKGNAHDLSIDSITTNILSQATAATPAVVYGQASTPSVSKWLIDVHFLESIRAEAERLTRLPPGLRLMTQQCGKANAYYIAQYNAVILCYELADRLSSEHWARIQNKDQSQQETVRYLAGLKFIMFHEIGHAIFNANFKEGSLAREETEADAFASAALIASMPSSQESDSVVWGVWSFLRVAGRGGAEDLSDEHELPGQRWANFACLLGGRFPEMLQTFVQSNSLSKQRSTRCQSEWRRTWNGFQTLTTKMKLSSR